MSKYSIILENGLAEDYIATAGTRYKFSEDSAKKKPIEIDRFGRRADGKDNKSSILKQDSIYYAYADSKQDELESIFAYSFDNIIFENFKQRVKRAKDLLGLENDSISLMDAEISDKDAQYVCRTSLLIDDKIYKSAYKIVELLDKITSESTSIIIDKDSRQVFIDNAKLLKKNRISINDLYDNRDIFFSDYKFSSYLKYTNDNTMQVNYFSLENNVKMANINDIVLDSTESFKNLNEIGIIELDYDKIEVFKEKYRENLLFKDGAVPYKKDSLQYYTELYKKAKANTNQLFRIDSSMNFGDSLQILKDEDYLNESFPFIADFDIMFLRDMYDKIKNKSAKKLTGGNKNGI